jgi:CubicO group peptidase (beta-lactamase class C family)
MLDRRSLFRSAGTAAGAALVLGASAPSASGMQPLPGSSTVSSGAVGRFDRPFTGFAPERTTLRGGTPSDVGLAARPIDDALGKVRGWTEPDPATGHPLFSGAVTMLVHNGVTVSHRAAGKALRYADAAGTELPPARQIAMHPDTIFDMASISKLFTSIVVLRLAEANRISVAAPAAKYLPEFGVNGKTGITVQQLLTHTSGLQPDLPTLWKDYPDIPSRRGAVLSVAPQTPAGTAYSYSDLNMLTLQFLAEKVTGSTLDSLVRSGITGPLRMADTGYNPPAARKRRIAATEFQAQPPRGLVWGQVHDEKAWSLGGVAGHAGVFSTARDMAVLAQAVLNGGAYGGKRILRPDSVDRMLTNYNSAFPDDSHGLGFELNQIWYMGALASPRTAGHTGFTGTMLVIDPLSRSIAILLTNRVHPSREWGSINVARETTATALATAMAVKPVAGRQSWYTAGSNEATATLNTPVLGTGRGMLTVGYRTFVDTEPTDTVTLEASVNGGEWQPLPVRASGPGAPAGEVATLSGNGHRAWWKVSARLALTSPPPTSVRLRWRYTADKSYRGRGVHLDDIRVTQGGRVLLDGEKAGGKFAADGWRLSDR